jgi:hypothetical protein
VAGCLQGAIAEPLELRPGEVLQVVMGGSRNHAHDGGGAGELRYAGGGVAEVWRVRCVRGAAATVRRPLRPCWRTFWLRFTYVASVLVKKY